jgi:diguanylate cyclase (GGDEF)-like protein/PAS domain S-box-containing protein
MLGYHSDEIGNDIEEWKRLAHPDDIEEARIDLQRHFERRTDTYSNVHRMKCRNGRYKWVLDRGRVIEWSKDAVPERMIGAHTDIDELMRAKDQLKIAAMVYQQSSEGMMITNKKLEIIDVNQAFTTITGYEKREVIGKKPTLLSSGRHPVQFYKKMWRHILEHGYWIGEVCNKSKSGEEFTEWLNISVIKDEHGDLDGYVGIFSDITKRKQQEELIHHQANYDALTDLINRRFFIELLEKRVMIGLTENVFFWLMYLDLSNFKDVNDALGHEQGDELLKQWSQRVQNHLRESDIFARLGGDEFAIAFGQVVDADIIENVADGLIAILNKPFIIQGQEVHISVNIGIVQYPKDGETVMQLLTAADQSLNNAKSSGVNQYSYYTPELQDALKHKMMLAEKMRKGLAEGHFAVYYQPIVNLTDNEIYKAESLLRWNDPELGFISPALFIPIAEQTGFIDALTEFVVKDVLLQQLAWQKKHTRHIQISINISPREFKSLQLQKANWFEALKTSGLMTKTVLFEITEGVLVDNDSTILTQLIEFRDLGIEVAIDDFGTGYSSLAYLHKFDIDYLKIDKQFVDDIETNSQMRALCEAIIVMSQTLGLKVIAEGVETQEQASILSTLGCDFYQGYLCSPAINGQAFEAQFLDIRAG